MFNEIYFQESLKPDSKMANGTLLQPPWPGVPTPTALGGRYVEKEESGPNFRIPELSDHGEDKNLWASPCIASIKQIEIMIKLKTGTQLVYNS